MIPSPDPDMRPRVDSSVKVLAALAVVSALLALLQRTSYALLPGEAGDFLDGLTVGLTFGVVGGWFRSRG